MKGDKTLNHKINFLVTDDDWLKLNKLLDKSIMEGKLKPRTSFSEYLRMIIKSHIKSKSNENPSS